MMRNPGPKDDRRVARLTAEEARRLLLEWKESGESLAGFSIKRGFNKERLRWWKNRIGFSTGPQRQRRRRRRPPEALGIAAMVPSGKETGSWSLSSAVSVLIGDEVRIEINDTAAVSADWLKEVVRGLREERRR